MEFYSPRAEKLAVSNTSSPCTIWLVWDLNIIDCMDRILSADLLSRDSCLVADNLFSVNINNGVVTHPTLVKFRGSVGRSGAVRASVMVHDKYASGSGRLGAATQGVGAARDIGPRNEAARTALVGNKRLGV